MRKIIALAVAVLVGFSSVFAAMPERIPHNVEKYKKICRENIQKGCIYNALDYCGLEGYIPIIIASDSLLPMWAGLATPRQAREMVERNYLDERLFNAPAGVYTLAPTEKCII